MNNNNTIGQAIDDALNALPDGDDRQLAGWIRNDWWPAFSEPVCQAIFRGDLEAMIRERARERGIEVKENQVEGLILRRMSAMRGRKRLPQYRMVRVVLLRGAPDVLEPRI